MISQIRLQLRYMAIKEMSTSDTFPVVLLCEIAQVSRAAYYKWLKRTVSVREEENSSLLEDIRLLYDQVNVTYGYRRIHHDGQSQTTPAWPAGIQREAHLSSHAHP